jgi:hypothetical protein
VDKLCGGSSVELSVSLEVDYWLKIDEMQKETLPTLIHHHQTHLILQDEVVVGDICALVKIAISTYGVEDAEVINTVLFNRNVRETSFEVFRVLKNPIMTIQFVVSTRPDGNDIQDFGAVTIEL